MALFLFFFFDLILKTRKSNSALSVNFFELKVIVVEEAKLKSLKNEYPIKTMIYFNFSITGINNVYVLSATET